MKLVLDIEDKSYQTVLDFISLLPEHKCRVLTDETKKLNLAEQPENKKVSRNPKPHKLLPLGTKLLVAITIHNINALDEELLPHLKLRNKYELGNDFYQSRLSVDTQFVEVTIGKPTALQTSRQEIKEGGLFLLFKGLNQTGVLTSSIKLPLQEVIQEIDKNNLFEEKREIKVDIVVDSLNYAFTRLSEQYEPWRKSHTGNIYDRILYQEKNGKWYPLDVLRNVVSVKQDEHQLAFDVRKKAMETTIK
jgi:hypothetical protein